MELSTQVLFFTPNREAAERAAALPHRRHHFWVAWVSVLALGLWSSPVLVPAKAGAFDTKDPVGLAVWSTNYTVRQWTAADGLPANRIQCLRQSRDGYLWIGTAQGLARFDGIQFRTFRGIGCDCLTEDREGALWVGTGSGLFRLKKGVLERIRYNTRSTNGWAEKIFALCPRRAGGVWVWDGDRLASVDDAGSERISQTDGLPGAKFLLEDRLGNVCFGSSGWLGFCGRWSPLQNSVEDMLPTLGIEQAGVSDAVDLGSADLWFASDGQLSKLKSPSEAYPAILKFPIYSASSLAMDEKQNLWIGRLDGLWRVRGNNLERAGNIDRRLTVAISSVIANREGGVWVGTESDGIYLVTPNRVHTIDSKEGLVDNDVWSVIAARDRSVWIATAGGVSQKIDGRFVNYGTESGLSTLRTICVAEDTQGSIWIGSESGVAGPGGVARFERGRFHGIGENLGFTMRDVRSIAPSPDGSVLVSGGGGVATWRDGKFLAPAPLHGGGILFVDRDTNYWSGFEELWRYRDEQWSQISTTGAHGLEPGMHAVIKQDETGALWLGSANQGVIRYQHGKFSSISSQHGLYSDLTLDVVEDDYGRYWFNSHSGIFWVWKRDLNAVADGTQGALDCVHYGLEDGMLSVEGNGGNAPNSCRTHDGLLWFPTTKGVAVVDPHSASLDELQPLVVIEEFHADGEVIYSHDPDFKKPKVRQLAPRSNFSGGVASPEAAEHAELTLAPGRGGSLMIDFTATSMISPEKVRFRYRLEGRDRDWIQVGGQRFVHLDGLAHGHYRFLVAACSSHGIWSDQPAAMRFRITPYFYQTWPFYLSSVAVAGGGLLGFEGYRRRVRKRIQNLEKEAALAAQRERLSRDLHDDLGGSLAQIALKFDLLRTDLPVGDDVNRELEKLSALARSAIENMSQIIWSNNPKFDSLSSMAAFLREFASNHFTDDVRFTFDQAISTDPGLHLSPDFRRNVFYAIKEGIHNISKHACAKNVSLRMNMSGTALEIELKDDGVGFQEPPAHRSGSGLGLDSMRKRIHELHGRIQIESRPGLGTHISISVPIR